MNSSNEAGENAVPRSNAEIYELWFRTASEGLIICNYKGFIQEVNPAASEMFGYRTEELLGQKIELLIPEKHRDVHKSHRANFNESPANRSMGRGMHLEAQRKSGELFPVEISLNHFGQGEDLQITAMVTDITKRVEIEKTILKLNEELENRVDERTEQLLQSQNLYFAIARNFPDGTISIFDKDLNYVFFEGKELYEAGVKSENIIGTSIKDRLPADVKQKVIDHLQSVLDGNRGTIEFKTKENYFELNAVPLGRSKNKQILVVERNITKQKKAEQEILNALSQEKALNELKSRFVSMASHEFRTPLSTVLSSISLISRYNDGNHSDKVNKHIGRIKSSVKNLEGILNDFLSLDKLEGGKIELRPIKISITKMISDLIDELEPVLKRGQRIKTSYDCEPETILADQQILKNVVINLMSNASKYSGEEDQIGLRVTVRDKILSIEVKDRGIGIPKEEQKHLFERFFRAKNVTNIGGTGLGLNIVRKYVSLMGGEIKYKSSEGKGTIFTVIIPIEEYE